MYEAQKTEGLEMKRHVRSLEKDNAILKRELKKDKKQIPLGINNMVLMSSLSKSVFMKNRDKNYRINQSLNVVVTQFKQKDIHVITDNTRSGVFGTISVGHIKNIQQKVAVKQFSERSTPLDVLVEAKVTSYLSSLSGGSYFPFVFGIVGSKALLLEFIGEDNSFSPTLHDVMENVVLLRSKWIQILLELCKAASFMHNKGILHNDLHSRNIILRNKQYVKIVDFGKATLVSDPLRYEIKHGSEKQKKYNTIHSHLAYELRNITGSHQSCESDVYTIGYNFKMVAIKTKFYKLSLLSEKMIADTPSDRPALSDIMYSLDSFLKGLS